MLIAPFRSTPPPQLASFDHPAWLNVPIVGISRTWRGDPAPAGLETTARVLWTADALWLGFTCGFTELDIDTTFDLAVERHGLWNRDVCEAFIQTPVEQATGGYKEFEVAPTGQWFDVAVRTPRVDVDWSWNGGMETAAAIDRASRQWQAVMRLRFDTMGGRPDAGDTWRANLFRIGRVDGVRHFLAYAPTGTATPDFHVPDRFAALVFAGAAP